MVIREFSTELACTKPVLKLPYPPCSLSRQGRWPKTKSGFGKGLLRLLSIIRVEHSLTTGKASPV